MIASLFRKSTPFNYTLLIVSVVVFYGIYVLADTDTPGIIGIIHKISLLGLQFASLFILNFIVKKNGLSRDNSFTILFYFLFLLFFPSVLSNTNLLLSNFFVLLSLRRLISLHSLKAPREKIFDASLWIFVAAIFHFWSILFLALVFISIFFHVSRDYRVWIIPFIAAFAAITVFLMFSLWLDPARIDHVINGMKLFLRIDYFTDPNQNIAISMFAPVVVLIFGGTLLGLSNRPLILQSSYKKVISAFVIAIIIYIISPSKSNDMLIYTFAPLAIMASTLAENIEEIWKREALVTGIALLAVVAFFIQL
ncbi:hypothetical protein [Flavobacterium silvaticum]|uniref:Beta-carotene 15,15'-monooxygenase n=1 Tax=Flavobacterium silvaticum TaxID=1852020 RepID=A0A972FTU4_9FLAO|nr:hypothetical protein [Flavobacterium silvaticum]NMH28373.1 hypothetical protein [Flavobacterium silvaticum]